MVTFDSIHWLQVSVSDSVLLNSGHYFDHVGDDSIGRSLIPTDNVHENVLKVFIQHTVHNERSEFVTEYRDRLAWTGITNDELNAAWLKNLDRFSVNDSVYAANGLYQHNRDLNVNGLVFWLDISDLPCGAHNLLTSRQIVRPDTSYYLNQAISEFFK